MRAAERARGRARLLARTAGALVIGLVVVASAATVVSHARGPRLSVLCSSIEDLCQEWGRAFRERTGVNVTVARRSAGEALTLVSQPDNRFDVWMGGPAEMYVLGAGRGLFTSYVPAGAEHVPDERKDPSGAWTGIYQGVLGFCSNTAVLERAGVAAPRSWNDLLDPRLRGLVSAPNPNLSGTGYTMVETQVARLGTDAAMSWLRQLNRNILQYTSSGLAPSGVAARGEVAVAVAFTQHCAKQIDQGNDELTITYPQDGTGHEIGAIAILAGTDQPQTARRFEDFMLSAEGQSLGAGIAASQLPARDDLPRDERLVLPSGSPLVELPLAESAGRQRELLDQFNRQVLA